MTHTEKINAAWEMHIITSWWITCYDIFTLAWKYRWGKIYDRDKKYIILSGSCELMQEKDGSDITENIDSSNGIFEIHAGIPHIFYFAEDTRMIEWFPEGTKSEEYERYRVMKK